MEYIKPEILKNHSFLFIMVMLLIILIADLLLFLSNSPPLEIEAPFRIILGSLFIFLLPGLIWGEILKLQSSHILETIALSFALTISIEVILLPIPFLFSATIDLWIILLFVVCAVGLVVMFLRAAAHKKLEFVSPLFNFLGQPFPLNISTLLIIIIIITVSAGTYRWGENFFNSTVGGESLLHMIFVRFYYSVPMVLNNIGMYQGTPPPNLIHLWEYLIAGWAKVINVDPLPLFYRARFIIPILGLSGMYLLIKNIFSDKFKTEIIFWCILIMSLGWLMIISNFEFLENDSFRGVTAFMGTIHHSDAAMDILIPLTAALILSCFHNPNNKNIFLMIGILTANFLWHEREFFQAVIYAGVLGLSKFAAPFLDKKTILKKWMLVMLICIIVSVFFVLIMLVKIPAKSHGYDELNVKVRALNYAFSPENFMGVRDLFNFPLFFILPGSTEAVVRELHAYNNYIPFLVLSALSVPILILLGNKKDKQLSLFFALLYFLVLEWNFSMLLLIVFTYSEIHMVTPRMLHIFSYIIIATTIYRIFEIFNRKETVLRRQFLPLAIMCCAGLLFNQWWLAGTPFGKGLSIFLSISTLILLVLFWLDKLPKSKFARQPTFFATVIGCLLFFLPILLEKYTDIIPRIIKGSRPPVEWFKFGNPIGFSPQLIQFLKSYTSSQKTFLVDMQGHSLISLYVPQYFAVRPDILSTVFLGGEEAEKSRKGKHPLFNFETARTYPRNRNSGTPEIVKHDVVVDWLSRYRVNYILVEKKYYNNLLPYFQQYFNDYSIVFNNQLKGEMVVVVSLQNFAAPNTLAAPEILSFPLKSEYLERPIKIGYLLKTFSGNLPKVIIYFDFYDKHKKPLSRLTYVLSGEKDHWNYSNQIVGEGLSKVNYITIFRNYNIVGKKQMVVFENILKEYNDGAKRINAGILEPIDIASVTVNLQAWYDAGGGKGGDVSVSFYSVDKYIVN